MISAEEFLRIIEQKDIVDTTALARIRATLGEEIAALPAASVAQELVSGGLLSFAVAQRMIEQIEAEHRGEAGKPPTPPPVRKSPRVTAETVAKPVESAAAPNERSGDDEQKRKVNPWIAVALMVLLGCSLGCMVWGLMGPWSPAPQPETELADIMPQLEETPLAPVGEGVETPVPEAEDDADTLETLSRVQALREATDEYEAEINAAWESGDLEGGIDAYLDALTDLKKVTDGVGGSGPTTPVENQPKPPERRAVKYQLAVEVAADGALKLNGRPVADVEELQSRVKERIAGKSGASAIVLADSESASTDVVKVLNALKECGIQQAKLSTRSRQPQ